MDERTLTALKASIRHWEKNRDAEHRDFVSWPFRPQRRGEGIDHVQN